MIILDVSAVKLHRLIRSHSLSCTSQTKFCRASLHRFQAKRDMGIQIDAKFRGALNHVLAVHASRKGFVFHLLAHAGCFNFGDCFV